MSTSRHGFETAMEFEYVRHPEAEALLITTLESLVSAIPNLLALRSRLKEITKSDLVDYLDHLIVEDDVAGSYLGKLKSLGFIPEVGAEAQEGTTVYWHPRAVFPRILLRNRSGISAEVATCVGAALVVEDIPSFLLANGAPTSLIEGSLLSPYRRSLVWKTNNRELWAVERRGWLGFKPMNMPQDYVSKYIKCREMWATRQRIWEDTAAGMAYTIDLAEKLVSELGSKDLAGWVAFSVEREYWEQRNWAGKIQKGLQDKLGLGWANHDHHTFRSSRNVFTQLIKFLETFGFFRRERFYAGSEAGWGAQVMEQTACRFAVFADVDLGAEEVAGDLPLILFLLAQALVL